MSLVVDQPAANLEELCALLTDYVTIAKVFSHPAYAVYVEPSVRVLMVEQTLSDGSTVFNLKIEQVLS